MSLPTAKAWRADPARRVCLFGMSGLGKTHLSALLRGSGDWFHYSVDYRIGTRYMGEHIVDNFKREAMRNPFLAELLLSDSIYIASNITFDNLAPLSTYLGKPGDPARGGLPLEEYSCVRNSTGRPRSRPSSTPRISPTGRSGSTTMRISSATAAARSARWWTRAIRTIRCSRPCSRRA